MFRPTRWFPDSSVTPRPPPTCTCSNRSAALLQLNKVTKAMADAEECIRLKPDWEKGYFRKGNAFETLAKTEEVRVRPPKLLSHTVHLQWKLTFNFCCRCCCEKALEAYKIAAEKNPDSRDCSNKVKQLTKVVQRQRAKEEKLSKQNFSFDNNKKK